MKKNVLLFLTIISILLNFNYIKNIHPNDLKINLSENVKIFLENYFKTKTYVLIGDKYNFGNKIFIFAVEYTKGNVEIKIGKKSIRV